MNFSTALQEGISHANEQRFELARQYFQIAFDLDPGHPDAELNLGAALVDLGRFAEAMPFAAASAIKLNTALAHGNHGICLFRNKRFAEAARAYRRVLAIHPIDATMHYNLAFALLSDGHYAEGWRELAWRKKTAKWHGREPIRDLPTWNGEPLSDQQTLVVFHEQGYGDGIMLSRFLPTVQQRASKLIVVCPTPLHNLYRDTFAVSVTNNAHDIHVADYQCSFFDLPAIFDVTEKNISRLPYLRTDSAKKIAWGQILDGRSKRVGLVWSGGKRHDHTSNLTDQRRSLTLQHFSPWFDIPDITFVSLQTGESAIQTDDFPGLHDWTSKIVDFADTAALIANLDLVVTVDTSVVHLAAGLGKPVWVLHRFDSQFPWLADSNAWYDTVQDFHQPSPGDWHSVIARVHIALQAWARPDDTPRNAIGC